MQTNINNQETFDSLFCEAVSAIDAGELKNLEALLIKHPGLVKQRLLSPGAWLRNKIGTALDGYFKDPFLLWFVADNPIRIGKLPSNVEDITRVIIGAVQQTAVDSFREQLNYTLGLVATGRIPRECGVQIALIDLLIDAGAEPGTGISAIAHGNIAAAAHLIDRGGKLTLAVAVCLERMNEVIRLSQTATPADLQVALTAAAFCGKAALLTLLIGMGAEINAFPDMTSGFHSHATPLHQAVSSGSPESVRVLVEAGAKCDIRDRIYDGTPLNWAHYLREKERDKDIKKKLETIAAYLINEKNL